MHAFLERCGDAREGSYIYGVRLRWQPSVIKNPIEMKKWSNEELVIKIIKNELDQMGLGHFIVEVVTCGEDDHERAVRVTTDPAAGEFGRVYEVLDQWFSLDNYLTMFSSRKNYYKLPQSKKDELFAQRIHPEAWEQEFLKTDAYHQTRGIMNMDGTIERFTGEY
jgi:hypothetical protein